MAPLNIDLDAAQVPAEELRSHGSSLRDALRDLDAAPEGDFLRVTADRELLAQMRRVKKTLPPKITDVVQLGIGGSSLGAQAVCRALLPPRYNETRKAPLPRFHFPDNIDPESFGALLDVLNPNRTLVHIVSKSGGTLETQAQLYALWEAFRRRSKSYRPSKQWVVTTGDSGELHDLAEAEDLEVLDFPKHVPGRYSVFTASGLLVPLLCGVPVQKILQGARDMESRCRKDAMLGPAGQLAALHFIHTEKHGRPIHVEMIYADALMLTGDWFRQIWAESLGKNGRGPTPVIARGATDQHSQIQLYVDGPDDKLYTILRVDRFRRGVAIGRRAPQPAIKGKRMETVLDAEARGTEEALIAARRPLVRLRIPKITPETVGELLLLQQLQTALCGALYGVNPFDQPGVEAGKNAAHRILTTS